MRIIDRKMLLAFGKKHPNAQSALNAWHGLMRQNRFTSFQALCRVFKSADQVGRVIVFNIKGNDYRLIAALHFNKQTAYILEVMTHAQYSKETWKQQYRVFD